MQCQMGRLGLDGVLLPTCGKSSGHRKRETQKQTVTVSYKLNLTDTCLSAAVCGAAAR